MDPEDYPEQRFATSGGNGTEHSVTLNEAIKQFNIYVL
jgi:hypothetical protein